MSFDFYIAPFHSSSVSEEKEPLGHSLAELQIYAIFTLLGSAS